MFGFSVVAILLTYSRAGFLGLTFVITALIARSKWKSVAVVAGWVAAISLASFLPERWFDRIATIGTYKQDGSAVSRLVAWNLAWQLALDHPFLGGGFRVVPSRGIWAKYAPEWYYETTWTHNTHSIYFHVLAEHGFLAFFLYVGLIMSVMFSLWSTRRAAVKLRGIVAGQLLPNDGGEHPGDSGHRDISKPQLSRPVLFSNCCNDNTCAALAARRSRVENGSGTRQAQIAA